MSASKFQVNGLTAFNSAYPANTAPIVVTGYQVFTGTSNKTITFYGASYSSGHRADRFVASNTKFTIDFTLTTGTWSSSYSYIDVTISGPGMTTVTARVNSYQPNITISTIAEVSQQSSVAFTVAFTVSGTVPTPSCTFRCVGFNTE